MSAAKNDEAHSQDKAYMGAYIGALLLQNHLAFDVLVVRALRPGFRGFQLLPILWRLDITIINNKEVLIRDVLFNLRHFIISYEVEQCSLS